MIRKLLGFVLFAVILPTSFAFAQCVPDVTITTAGIYPDSATNLAPATVGVAYNQVIQARIPQDTVVSINGLPPSNVTISNITVTAVSGLPPGLTYSCTPAGCVFPGGSNGCMLISGTPTTAGVYTINVVLTTNASFIGFPISQTDTVDYYVINVGTSSGIAVVNSSKFELLPHVPNPASNFTDVQFTSPVAREFSLTMYNMLGKEVISRKIRGVAGLNKIRLDLGDKPAGVYMISLDNGSGVLTRRLIVTKK